MCLPTCVLFMFYSSINYYSDAEFGAKAIHKSNFIKSDGR